MKNSRVAVGLYPKKKIRPFTVGPLPTYMPDRIKCRNVGVRHHQIIDSYYQVKEAVPRVRLKNFNCYSGFVVGWAPPTSSRVVVGWAPPTSS